MTTKQTRRRPPSPEGIKHLDENLKDWMISVHEDLYPKLQSYAPGLSGVTNAVATYSCLRSGRVWVVSLTLRPLVESEPLISIGGTFNLPFNTFANLNLLVRVDGAALVAWSAAGSTLVMLPNFNTSNEVTITATAAE